MTRGLATATLAAALAALAPQAIHADQMMNEWDAMISSGVLISANTPPTSTHYTYVVSTAMYEAWAAYEPEAIGPVYGNKYDGVGGEATEANKREAVSHAAYHAMLKMTPSLEDNLRALMRGLGYSPEDETPPALLGKEIGIAIVGHHKNDGSNWENGYADTTGYQPRDPSIEDAYQPLTINGVTQVPIAPHWKFLEPFAMKTVSQFRPAPPAVPGTPEWDAQIQEIIDFSANLTDYQKASLEWWLPPWGQPPPLHCEIDRDYATRHNTSFDEDMKSQFLSHAAMYDASIVCWEAKYVYDYIRPVTAIRNLGDKIISAWGGPGAGTVQMMARDFIPYQVLDFVTPPFPEYTSGHATFAGAWAEAMTRLHGPELDHVATVDYLIIEDKPLPEPIQIFHDTWWDAAAESGIGRLWAGVHFHDANVNGQETGRLAGVAAHNRAIGLYEGNLCRDINMLNLAGPVGLTNLSLLQGSTLSGGNEINGFVGADVRRNRGTVVGTEFGGWDLVVNERGIVSGTVDVSLTDAEGVILDTVSVPIIGRTIYKSVGTIPGIVRVQTGLALNGSIGRGAGRVALALKAVDIISGNADTFGDLVALPANAEIDGTLAVLFKNQALTREKIRLRNIAAEIGCLAADDIQQTRANQWDSAASLETPRFERNGGQFRLLIAPARANGVGPALSRAQNGLVRAAALGSHHFTPINNLDQEDLETITIDRLVVAAPSASINIQGLDIAPK